MTIQSLPGPAPPATWHQGCPTAPWCLRAAGPAPSPRHHWGHPAAPQRQKAGAAPGTLGQTGSDTAHGYNGGRKSRTAGLEDAADQSRTSPKCWPPSPSTIKLADRLICTGRSHAHLSVILLCLSRGAALGDGTGQAVFSLKVGNAFPRPSSPRAGLGRPPSTLAMCFRPCWPREAAVRRHSGEALSPDGMFPHTTLSPVCTRGLCPFPTPLRQLFPTSGSSSAAPHGAPCPRQGSLAQDALTGPQHPGMSRGAAVAFPSPAEAQEGFCQWSCCGTSITWQGL